MRTHGRGRLSGELDWLARGSRSELGQQPLLGLALDRRDHLDVALERRAAELGGQQVVDLEDAGGVVHLDLDPNGALGRRASI